MSELSEIFRKNEIPFGYRIGYLFNFFTGPVYRAVEKELDVIRPDFATMFCIAHLATVTARDVTLLTGIPKNSISRAVAKLARRRLIRRDARSAKGRQIVLTLTPAGLVLYQTILDRFRARESRMVAVLSATERRTLDRLLAKMVLRDDGWSLEE